MADLVPYHDRDGFIWFDGKLVPWREANLHVLSHALHYASAVFEGERAYGGEIFELTQHSQRLYEGAKTLDFTIPYSVAEIDKACRDTVKANKLTDCYVRPIAWRGSEMMGVSAQATKIHLAVAAWDWGSYFPMEQRLKGIRLTIAQYRRPDPATAPAKTKAAGLYMICTLEKHRAERMGYADALMFDWRGRVAECTGANIFFVKDGVLHTPTPDCFLDGITRRTVIGLAKKRGIAGGRPRHHARRARHLLGVLPGRHRRRGHARLRDRPQHLQARQDQRDADQRLQRRRPAQEGRGGVAVIPGSSPDPLHSSTREVDPGNSAGMTPYTITCVPTSTTRSLGMRKYSVASSARPASQMKSRSCQRGISDFMVVLQRAPRQEERRGADVDVEVLAPAMLEDLRHARRLHEAVVRDHADEGIRHACRSRCARGAARGACPPS